MKMKNFSKTLLVIMIGTMGFSSCADSWEEMRKEKYEKEWVKTFGEVDPNHTWNLATQVTADLAIKEDALTEYTFKVYTSDPIWGTDAKLLAKATVKTDEVGYAETQIKFDAPSSQERYYITRTDSHGRRLLKVSDIENKKIGVKFGISNYSAESRAGLITEGDFPVINLPDYFNDLASIINSAASLENGLKNSWNNTTFDFNQAEKTIYKVSTDNFEIEGINFYTNTSEYGKYKLIIDANCTWDTSNNKYQVQGMDIIITPGSNLTVINDKLELNPYTRLFIMNGATLTIKTKNGNGDNASLVLQSDNNDSQLMYNAGTINVNYLCIKAGNVYNTATGIMNIDKEIDFQCDPTGTLTNYGKIKVESIFGNGRTAENEIGALFSGQHGTINNACFIDVKEEFNILNLNLKENSAIESKYIVINNVTLRQSSILRSEEFSAQNAKWIYVGDTESGRALISTNHTNYLHDGSIDITGPIYYESNTYEDPSDETTIKDSAPLGVGKVGSAPFLIIPDGFYDEEHDDISKADCVGHGNIPKEFEKIVDKSIEWVVAFEDLGSTGDYDFNDAVLGISHDKENNQITVTPLAAGGTMHAEIFYNNENLGEIHNLLGNDATNVPINVNNRGSEGTKKEISVGEDFSITKDWKNFSIQVNGKSGTVYQINPNKEAGDAPQAICMPAPWFWAKEGINIHDAYIQFGGWVTNQETNQKWHQNPTKEKIAL